MAAHWRLAASLKVLLAECNARFPHRDKASDGTIGDARHQHESTSDHNAWLSDKNGVPVVRALDVDSGPGLNPDEAHDQIGDIVAAAARQAGLDGHPAMGEGSYVIHEQKIASAHSDPPWRWRTFRGDPHTSHPHISVALAQRGYDNTRSWGVHPAKPPKPKPAVKKPAPKPAPTIKELLEMNLSDKVTIPAHYEVAKATGDTTMTVAVLLARLIEYAFKASRK